MDGAPLRDPYEECLDLETAGELMNARVGRIMRAIYTEEAQAEPDPDQIARLRASKRAIARDRDAMRGNKPSVVATMIEKYTRLRDADLVKHE